MKSILAAGATIMISFAAQAQSPWPNTLLHYAPNGNFSGGTYLPGADGFNIADISSASQLQSLPAGVKGLAYAQVCNGANSSFQGMVNSYRDANNVSHNFFGFYFDEVAIPSLGSGLTPCPIANLLAEADYVHSQIPGAYMFMIPQDLTSEDSPSFSNYNSANTHFDLFGLTGYPCTTSGCDFTRMGKFVNAMKAQGVTIGQIIPVYQAFGGGGYSHWVFPTVAQTNSQLAAWAQVVPNPVFDFAYSWGVQSNDTALVSGPANVLAVYAQKNGGSSGGGGLSWAEATSTHSTITDATGAVWGYTGPENGNTDYQMTLNGVAQPCYSANYVMENGVVYGPNLSGGWFKFSNNNGQCGYTNVVGPP